MNACDHPSRNTMQARDPCQKKWTCSRAAFSIKVLEALWLHVDLNASGFRIVNLVEVGLVVGIFMRLCAVRAVHLAFPESR